MGMDNIRVAVVGSRNFPNRYMVERFVYLLPDDVVIVSGGARGVDRWAELTAKHHRRQYRIHRAQWQKYGKAAGFVRNNVVVKDADIVVAFHHGGSSGTRHTIDLCARYGVPCVIVRA